MLRRTVTFRTKAGQSSIATLHIGDVSLPVFAPSAKERVPSTGESAAPYLSANTSSVNSHVRWMAQKDLLGQDMCLCGPAGPARRWIVTRFCALAQREAFFLSLTRDTTESDLKQRKEIRAGTLFYENQAAVRAATEGHVLVIDGLERAERNVLPVLNNLLENREMHLDDGRMLIHPQRFDELAARAGSAAAVEAMGLLRVHERFRVVALTVPPSEHGGVPLDPPLRSRFQCLFVHRGDSSSSWRELSLARAVAERRQQAMLLDKDDAAPPKEAPDSANWPPAVSMTRLNDALAAFRGTANAGGSETGASLSSELPQLGPAELRAAATAASLFPDEPVGNIVARVFPWRLYCLKGAAAELATRISDVEQLLKRCAVPTDVTSPAYTLDSLTVDAACQNPRSRAYGHAIAKFDGGRTVARVKVGARLRSTLGEVADVSKGGAVDASLHLSHFHRSLLGGMLQSHAADRHIILVGPAGCGKTAMVRELARMLGYDRDAESVHLYADMTSRDLFQRRATDPESGDTVWEPSALLDAARHGKLVVLDGADQLTPGSLAVLEQLLVDGRAALQDGTVFVPAAQYAELRAEVEAGLRATLTRDAEAAGFTVEEAAEAELARRGVYKVHPSFRVVATARRPSTENGGRFWLTHDVAGMFDVHSMDAMPDADIEEVVAAAAADALKAAPPQRAKRGMTSHTMRETAASLVRLMRGLAQERAAGAPNLPQLSVRQLLRIAAYAAVYPEELHGAINEALLVALMPQLVQEQLLGIIAGHVKGAGRQTGSGMGSLTPGERAKAAGRAMLSRAMGQQGGAGGSAANVGPASALGTPGSALVVKDDDVAGIKVRNLVVSGETVTTFTLDALPEEHRALVPHVTNFFDNELHARVAGWLVKQLSLRAPVLLVGNQGVGKNKIVDRVLATAQLPRQYLQLHRDTTVASLTINPAVVNGRIVWEDSALVKAVTHGHVLVVDEIDKAPIEVVQLLKGLIEDRELRLSDGRLISGRARPTGEDAAADAKIVPIHPNFRVIVLANPPGFPFHGHDFYRECGDLFATVVLGNPDPDSQLRLVRQYGPNVPTSLLLQLVNVFRALGEEWTAGRLQYPFSTRELIAVVKHLQAFPSDGVYQALNNVFMFDCLDQPTMDAVRRVLHTHLRRASPDLVLGLASESPMPVEAEASSEIAMEDRGVHRAAVGALKVLRSTLVDASVNPEASLALRPTFRAVSTADEAAEAGARQSKVFDEVEGRVELQSALHETKVAVCGSEAAAKEAGEAAVEGVVALPDASFTMLVRVPNAPASEEEGRAAGDALALCTLASPRSTVATNPCPVPRGKACVVALPAELGAGKLVLTVLRNNADVVVASPDNGRFLFVSPVAGRATLAELPAGAMPLTKGSEETVALPPLPVSLDTQGVAHGAISIAAPNAGHGTFVAFADGALRAVPLPDAAERVLRHSVVENGLYHVVATKAGAENVDAEAGAVHYLVRLPRRDQETQEEVEGEASFTQLIAEDPAVLRGLSLLPSEPARRHGEGAQGDRASEETLGVSREGNAIIRLGGSAATAAPGGKTRAARLTLSSSKADLSGASFDPKTRQFTSSNARGEVSAIDTKRGTARTISSVGNGSQATHHVDSTGIGVSVSQGGQGGQGAQATAFDAMADRLQAQYSDWKNVADSNRGQLGAPPSKKEIDLWYTEPRKPPSGTLKHGEEDNMPHHGGNTFAGGTGGTDTAGLGGLIGPYRLDKGWDIHQVDPELKKQIPQHLKDEAKRMGKEALAKRLEEIGMSQREYEAYMRHFDSVKAPIHQLRLVLEGLKSKQEERVWLRHQTDGVWDDAKLVEGITGERNVFKRRADATDQPDALKGKGKKKRLLFLLDVSASMYRFNRHDHRLEKLVECAIMITEALSGFRDTLDYSIVGHNGDGPDIPLVPWGQPPQNRKERSDLCSKMIAHSQFCWSGDSTLHAMQLGIQNVTKEEAEDYFVFLISDANLQQYGYTPQDFSRLIQQDQRVKMYCIFIASFGAQASHLQSRLPAGRGFECLDTRELPHVLKRIFVANNILSR